MNGKTLDDASEDAPTTDCDRCGRERTADPRRFILTLEDQTDATIQYERRFLCGPCWNHVRDLARRCSA